MIVKIKEDPTANTDTNAATCIEFIKFATEDIVLS